MIGFFLYAITAVSILLPLGLSVAEGTASWTTVFSSPVLGPPAFLFFAAILALGAPRLAGCLAFAGAVSCWLFNGSKIIPAALVAVSSQSLDALSQMDTQARLNYALSWLPTLNLILATLYSLYRALKIPQDRPLVVPDIRAKSPSVDHSPSE